MATHPTPMMFKQAAVLFPKDKDEQRRFVEALIEGVPKEQALIVLENRAELGAFPKVRPEPWQPDFVVRVMDSFRPAKHPLYQKGAYYTLDLSSVFAARPILEIQEPPRTILDLCASPGGKAIFAWKAFNPELLACNETVKKRTGSLIGNLERCHIERSLVWTADPSVWAKRYPQGFDLVIVDAPCSGQSLLAKGDHAPDCFLPSMIDMCVGRQRRITGNAFKCLRPGGHMLYSTCTYSEKEDEKIIAWLLEEYPGLEPVPVPQLAPFQSKFESFPCYRLFPQQGFGAGAFTCLLRKTGEPPEERPDFSDMPAKWRYGEPNPHQSAEPPTPVAVKSPPAPPRQNRPKPGRRKPGRRK
jgi:16S rRNA C967 or C1407 C5-methylase (RsmB/RsmF family)